MCCEQARATLEEFEASITKDSVKHPPPDGTVHPLAAYTLSFLKRLFAYEATIDTLFSDEENEVLSAVSSLCRLYIHTDLAVAHAAALPPRFFLPDRPVPASVFSTTRGLGTAAGGGASGSQAGEAAERRQQEGVNEAAADAVRGAVGHMLRVLMENLETKSRTYKNKVCASLECAPLQDPPAADLVPSMWMCFLHVFHFIVMGTHN